MDGKAGTFWATGDGVTAASLEVDLGREIAFNRAAYEESVSLGQRVESYALEAWHQGEWKEVVAGTTIGYRKLDRFGDVTASRIRLNIRSARDSIAIRSFGVYKAEAGA